MPKSRASQSSESPPKKTELIDRLERALRKASGQHVARSSNVRKRRAAGIFTWSMAAIGGIADNER